LGRNALSSSIHAAELPALLRAIEVYRGKVVTRLAMKLMALTFVRASKLIGARWDEFDLEARRWNIPKERMKMKTPHIVPLATQTVELLELLRTVTGGGDLLFAGDVDRKKPMSNNTILLALKRMNYKDRMTGHGFRGLASTLLHEQGWPHEHIELQLAHAPRNAAACNHALYLGPRAKMMQEWASFLEQIQRGGKIIPFRAGVAQMKRGRKSEPYTMWLCFQMACVVDEDTEFLPQHKQREGAIGGPTMVGKGLHLSPEAVEYHANNARRRRETKEGMLEYCEWSTKREKKWWCYHARYVEKRKIKLLEFLGEIDADTVHLTSKQVESLADEAQKRLGEPSGKEDYNDWLAWYERRDAKGRVRPLVYQPLSCDDPVAMAIDERRKVNGLRTGLTNSGRKRKVG
jgi:hypothetical protein